VTELGHGRQRVSRLTDIRGYGIPILTGLVIVAAGTVPFLLLARLNARVRPDLPWAAVVTLAYLAVIVIWLNGSGPPTSNADRRRQRLRLWLRSKADPYGQSPVVIIALMALLAFVWVMMSRTSPLPDLTAYPTTSYRWSMFLMGGVVAGVVEEVAYRGYMQTGLEEHDPANAIWITSLVFTVSHITHGIGTLLVMAPGLFIASMLYGALARRTGTILPGIALHVLGDLARVYFGVLRGDSSLLFVN